jgi:hypothetical protein
MGFNIFMCYLFNDRNIYQRLLSGLYMKSTTLQIQNPQKLKPLQIQKSKLFILSLLCF